MALDYSGLLTRGGLNVGGRALGIANQVQDLKARQFGLAQAQEEANYLNQQRQAQQAAQQQKADLVSQAQELYRQGDINAIADFSIANPELAKQIFNAQGYTQAEDMRRISNRFANVYASQDPIATLQQEVEVGEAQGLDMSDSRAILESGISGEEIRKLAGMTLASVDPNRQQAIAKAGGQYQQVKTDKGPASVQELNEYKAMPDGPLKEAYGRKIGLITKEGFELNQAAMKLIETADNDYRASMDSAGSYENLAMQFENLDSRGGVVGNAVEKIKEITGEQDAVTSLKKKYASIVNKEVMSSLPPGAASDKDIDFAKQGFLLSSANPKEIASFLRGLSKLQKAKALYSEWRSNYISEKGTPRDITNEWNKYKKSDEYKQRFKEVTEQESRSDEVETQEGKLNFSTYSDEDLLNG